MSPIYTKKREKLCLSLVPRIEAFELPILSKRATPKPHADMYNNPTPAVHQAYKYTHGRTAHVGHAYNIPTGHSRCFVLDRQFESCEVSNRQNQSVVNAFSICLAPPYRFSLAGKTIGAGPCNSHPAGGKCNSHPAGGKQKISHTGTPPAIALIGRKFKKNIAHRPIRTRQNAKANTRPQEQASGKQAVEVQHPACRGTNGKNNSKRSR